MNHQPNMFDHLKAEAEAQAKRGCLAWPDLKREPIRWNHWIYPKGGKRGERWESWEFDYNGVTYFIQQYDNDSWLCVSKAADPKGEGWIHVDSIEAHEVLPAFLSQKPEPPEDAR